MKHIMIIGLLFVSLLSLRAQSETREAINAEIMATEADIESLQEQIRVKEAQKEDLLLTGIQLDLQEFGLPKLEEGEQLVKHAAMSLVYSEAHEQARWVAHVIVPAVIKGNVSRSNDFRIDPQVGSGSAEEVDYFLKYEQVDGSFEYDGFGYDRGHLAPSADFRWSEKALSESYFYSNMSPQKPEFNRGRWAELEGYLREYIVRNSQTQLFVVTGPVLKEGLSQIKRSKNGLSIPEKYFKVVLDLNQQRAIAFLMPNHELAYPVETYSVSIDSVEAVTGIDFFHALPDELEESLEAQRKPYLWLPDKQQTDAEPILPDDLPKGAYNTVQARFFADRGDQVSICGTVVDARKTRNGHIFLNLDKKFPNHIFTVAIWKSNALNFSYPPHETLMNERICVEGKVKLSNGVPTIEPRSEKDLMLIE